ncbi:MAG: HAMP domain-containing sensor histidine kinase [Ahrensia sp.]
MSFTSQNLPDKTIVDRRRTYRNDALRRTVNNTREKLHDGANVLPSFTKRLLFMHAGTMASTMAALPFLILAAGLAGFAIGFGLEIFAWAAVACMLYATIIKLGRAIGKKSGERQINIRRYTVLLISAHFIAGLGWVAFVLVPCANCGPVGTDTMFKAITLVIAIAATATLTFTLRWATLTTFTVPVLTFLVMKILDGHMLNLMLAGVLVAALCFFSLLASHLNKATCKALDYETRHDALIGELEMAKSISEEARRRAEDANLAKSRFLASMSHELRTPLNAIIGFSEVMLNEVLGPMGNDAYKTYAKDIHGSGEHLLNLINEILDLSRIEAGKYDMRNEAQRLDDIALDCISLMRLKIEQKNITVTKAFEKDLGQFLGDERALRQIMLNLLSNAVKFTPQNGKIEFKVGWTASGGQYVCVTDNGPGIPEDEIPIVLSAFGQGSISIKNADQGTGLGLPIVQALIAMHDGKFKLTSKLREGTQAAAFFPPSRTLEALPSQNTASRSKRSLRPQSALKSA